MDNLEQEKSIFQDDLRNLKLPKNRLQSFFDILLNRFASLLLVGLFLLVFSLPALIITIINNVVVFDLNNKISNGLFDPLEGARKIFDSINMANLLLILALMILFVGVAGLINITKRLIFQEDVSFFYDFKKGVRSNAKIYVLIGFVLGILNWLLQYLLRYSYFVQSSNNYQVALGIVIGLAVLFVLFAPLILFQTDLYNLSLFHQFKNSFILLLNSFFKTLPFVLTTILPWTIIFISMDGFLYVIVFILLVILILPLEILALQQYSFSLFDQFINKDHHPTIYKKGIYK